MTDLPWNTDGQDQSTTHANPMGRARELARSAMESAATETTSGTANAQTGQKDERQRDENITRHLKHNLDLKAEKHIRIHGGFQWDLFRDNETGQDLPWAA